MKIAHAYKCLSASCIEPVTINGAVSHSNTLNASKVKGGQIEMWYTPAGLFVRVPGRPLHVVPLANVRFAALEEPAMVEVAAPIDVAPLEGEVHDPSPETEARPGRRRNGKKASDANG